MLSTSSGSIARVAKTPGAQRRGPASGLSSSMRAVRSPARRPPFRRDSGARSPRSTSARTARGGSRRRCCDFDQWLSALTKARSPAMHVEARVAEQQQQGDRREERPGDEQPSPAVVPDPGVCGRGRQLNGPVAAQRDPSGRNGIAAFGAPRRGEARYGPRSCGARRARASSSCVHDRSTAADGGDHQSKLLIYIYYQTYRPTGPFAAAQGTTTAMHGPDLALNSSLATRLRGKCPPASIEPL